MTVPKNKDGTPVSQRQWLMLIAERDALHAKVVTVEALLRYPAFELIQRYFLGEYLGDEPWRAEILTLRNAAFNLSQQAERAEAERDALRLEVGVLRSQILGERVGMGCIDGASFPQALSIALQTESAMNNAMKAKK